MYFPKQPVYMRQCTLIAMGQDSISNYFDGISNYFDGISNYFHEDAKQLGRLSMFCRV